MSGAACLSARDPGRSPTRPNDAAGDWPELLLLLGQLERTGARAGAASFHVSQEELAALRTIVCADASPRANSDETVAQRDGGAGGGPSRLLLDMVKESRQRAEERERENAQLRAQLAALSRQHEAAVKGLDSTAHARHRAKGGKGTERQPRRQEDRREAAAAVVDESLRRQIGALTRSLEGTVRERDGLALRLAQLELQARGLADDLRAARRNERRHNSERTLLEQWYLTLQEEFRAFVQSGHAPPQPPPPAAPPAAASVAAAASAAAATPAATPVAAGGDQTQVASEVRPDEPALAVATTAKQPDPEPLPQFTSATSTTDLPQQERSPPAPQQLLSSATSTTDLPQQQSSQPVSSATPTAPVPQPPQVPPPRRASEMKDVLTRLKLREDNIRFRELLRLFTESFTETDTLFVEVHGQLTAAGAALEQALGTHAFEKTDDATTVAVAVGTLRPAKAQTEAADLRLVQLREQLKERLGLLRSTTEDIDKRSAPMLTAPTPPAAERPAKVGVRRHTVATKVELAEVVHARENVLRETAEAELRHVRARLNAREAEMLRLHLRLHLLNQENEADDEGEHDASQPELAHAAALEAALAQAQQPAAAAAGPADAAAAPQTVQ